MATTKKGGLGRGLGSILLDNEEEKAGEGGVSVVRVAEIEPKAGQPRKTFDAEELQNLASSLAQYGMIQPITVRRVGDMYQIVTGERRWRAARMAGLSEVPVLVVEADDRRAAELALVENIQRANLNPFEEAAAIADLMEEFGLTQDDAAGRIGRNRSTVANLLRLLELPQELREMVVAGALTTGHAKALLGLRNPDKLVEAAKVVTGKELTVRATEALVKKWNAEQAETQSAPRTAVNYTRELERKIEGRIGRRVKIVEKGENSSITIGYTDHEDLEIVLCALCGKDFVDSLD
ncbi:MAG: ParB/RepB/Spo0J family partition protein [Ruminococcus sp.]|nr:ParB/RepB/Spo0J family partition protein [Candidatus Apopatosoma intestinale]